MTDTRTNRAAQSADLPPVMGRFGPGPRPFGQQVEHAKDARQTLLRLWQYLRRHRLALVINVVLVVVTTAMSVLGPFLLGQAIDTIVRRAGMASLVWIMLSMIATYLAAASLTWLQSYLMIGVAQRTVRDIRTDLFARLQELPLRFFDARPHGELMSRLTNDLESVSQVLADGVVQIVAGILGMLGIAAVMLALNPILALVSITAISGMSLTMNRWIAPRLRSGFRAQQAALGTLNGLIEETISGQRVVKAHHREPVVIAEFAATNAQLRQAATRAQVTASFMGPLMNGVGNLGLAVVAGFGGWMALQGLATVGTIASFITFSRQFGRPLNELATLYGAIQSAVAGAERVFAVIDQPPEVDDPNARPLEAVHGEVVFEQVDFGYTPGTLVLHDVSLYAQPGQTIALVGPTGAGKTTVISLLARFYDVDHGAILVDGQDIRTLQRADLRRQLGIVLQDTFLFGASVLENIRYGRPSATLAEVHHAAILANADQFIQRLPQGYDTLLSERGNNLSQGQRQLLAIARAILADPRILVLDEATSSVDTRTEQHIQEAMLRLMQGRTSFVIAHRLSTIRAADQILVIDQGTIIERGSHAELLAAGGFYARLYASQFAN